MEQVNNYEHFSNILSLSAMTELGKEQLELYYDTFRLSHKRVQGFPKVTFREWGTIYGTFKYGLENNLLNQEFIKMFADTLINYSPIINSSDEEIQHNEVLEDLNQILASLTQSDDKTKKTY